jgi:hypothetical protein
LAVLAPGEGVWRAGFMLFPRIFLHDLAYPHPCADALFSEATRPLTQSATGRRTPRLIFLTSISSYKKKMHQELLFKWYYYFLLK